MTTTTESKSPELDALIKADECRLYFRKTTITVGYQPTETTGPHDVVEALAISLNLQLGWSKYAVTRTRAATRHALRASVSLADLQTLVAAAAALVTLGDVKGSARA